MNCRSVVTNLSSLIDCQLSVEDREAIWDHLAKCDACRAEERELRCLKRLLSNSCGYDIAPDFEARLREWVSQPNHESHSVSEARWQPSVWQLAPVTILAVWLISQTILPSHEVGAKGVRSVSSSGSTTEIADEFGESETFMLGQGLTTADYPR